MPWVKLTDDFPKNIKVISAGLEARALYVTALCHCNENLTDGFVADKFLPSLGMITGLQDHKASAEKLVEVGLWERSSDGYVIHDYHDYNPTKEEVLETRTERAESGRVGGIRSGESRRSAGEAKAKQIASENKAESNPVPVPVPGKSSCADAQTPESEKPSRKLSERDIVLADLEKCFSQNTGLPLPPRQTVSEKKAGAKRWWNPLWSIYDVSAGADVERAKILIIKSIEQMRLKNWDIFAPQSIQQTAASIAANGNSGSQTQVTKVYQ